MTKNKRNQRLKLPISPELADLVCAVPIVSAKYLFPEQRAVILDVRRRAGLSMQFKRICERLGFKDKSFDCLRHSVAANTEVFRERIAEANLADPGQIERDADFIGLLQRERTPEKAHEANLILAKQRGGETGLIELHFNDQFRRFEKPSSQVMKTQTQIPTSHIRRFLPRRSGS